MQKRVVFVSSDMQQKCILLQKSIILLSRSLYLYPAYVRDLL